MRKLPPGLINPGIREMAILSVFVGILAGLVFYRALMTEGACAVGIVMTLVLIASALNSSLPKGRSRYLCFLIALLSTGLGCIAGLALRDIISKLFR